MEITSFFSAQSCVQVNTSGRSKRTAEGQVLLLIVSFYKKLRNFLPDYIPHFHRTTFQTGVDFDNKAQFWDSFGRWLRITSTSNYEAFRAQEILPILSKMTQCLETSKWFSS